MSSSVSVQGQELIEGRAFLDACEAKWLVTLVAFDADGGYELDGHTSSVAWLVERCGMGRSTAKEKVRVAHELRRRPVIGDAFLDGRLTYSKARVLTRLVGLDDERDAEFVDRYADQTADHLERLVRYWNLCHGDDPRPPDPYDQPRVRFQPGFGGANGRIIIEGANEDLSRAMNMFDAYGSFLFFRARNAEGEPVDEAPMEPPVLHADNTDEPAITISAARGDASCSSVWEPAAVDEAPMEPQQSLAQKRFDWFIDLMEEIALVHDHELDPDRATVAVTVPYESLLGSPGPGDVGVLDAGPILSSQAVRRMVCDCDIARLVFRGESEVIDVGRKTRTWTKAQRRAIRARHNNKCAVKGCDRRITEIHHLHYWENGGRTCIENGIPLCSRHHHMVHDLGWAITWNHHTGITTFTGPLQQTLYTESDPFLVRPPTFAAA